MSKPPAKSIYGSLCITVTACLFVVGCGAGQPEGNGREATKDEADLCIAVVNEPDRFSVTEVLDLAPRCADVVSFFPLAAAATIAAENGRVGEGFFYYMAALARFFIDGNVYKLRENHIFPFVIIKDAYREKYLPAVLDSPEAVDEALDLMRAWRPKVMDRYVNTKSADFERAMEDEKEILSLVRQGKSESIRALEEYSVLFRNPEYVKAFKSRISLEALPQAEFDLEENKAAYDAALAEMDRIEKTVKISAEEQAE